MTTSFDLPQNTRSLNLVGVDLKAVKTRQQAMWASGDFALIGNTLQIVGETLCEAADLDAGAKVLDVACGNGNAALAAAHRFCHVVGVDYVPALLARGRERASAERLPIHFVGGDAEQLPFPAESFDAVPSSTLPSRPLQCDSTIARARMTRPSIAYLASDEVGREIAERLAALAGMTAAGLAPREFGWALSDGRQAGVVVTLPPASRRTTTTVFCGARVSALIETRATLITRPTP